MKYIFICVALFTCFVTVSAANVDLGNIPVTQTDLFGETTTTNAGGLVNTSSENAVSGTEIQYTTPGVNYPTVQTPTNTSKLSLSGLMSWIIGLINYVIQFILVLSLVAFLWGVFKLIFVNAANEAERAKAKKFMLWGIIALFVMTSVWGLVNVLKTSVFGGGSLIIPQLK